MSKTDRTVAVAFVVAVIVLVLLVAWLCWQKNQQRQDSYGIAVDNRFPAEDRPGVRLPLTQPLGEGTFLIISCIKYNVSCIK
jgi:hypothetical protein